MTLSGDSADDSWSLSGPGTHRLVTGAAGGARRQSCPPSVCAAWRARVLRSQGRGPVPTTAQAWLPCSAGEGARRSRSWGGLAAGRGWCREGLVSFWPGRVGHPSPGAWQRHHVPWTAALTDHHSPLPLCPSLPAWGFLAGSRCPRASAQVRGSARPALSSSSQPGALPCPIPTGGVGSFCTRSPSMGLESISIPSCPAPQGLFGEAVEPAAPPAP